MKRLGISDESTDSECYDSDEEVPLPNTTISRRPTSSAARMNRPPMKRSRIAEESNAPERYDSDEEIPLPDTNVPRRPTSSTARVNRPQITAAKRPRIAKDITAPQRDDSDEEVPLPTTNISRRPTPSTVNRVPPEKRSRIAEENTAPGCDDSDKDDSEDEEALAALVEHRGKEVDRLKHQLNRATNQLRACQERLRKLRLQKSPETKPEIRKVSTGVKKRPASPAPEKREHKDLIPSVKKSSSARVLKFYDSQVLSSRHRRKLRCLELNPVNNRLFATSALDGLVGLWQIQGGGSDALPLGAAVDCSTPGQRRWPEAIAWHPSGDRLFATYTAANDDSQVSVFDMNAKGQSRVTFIEPKPHLRGIINSISFLPAGATFATGGSDHAVVLWSEWEESWKPKLLHRNQHTAAVMGAAGLLHRPVLVSVGADRKIIGYNLGSGRVEYTHQVEHKCMSIVPNPVDTNLFMVQTGSPEKQLRLLDIRLRRTEIHSFGWRQESSDTQSALINQDWSPDGWYISSGTADPAIHIFDIRYNSPAPCQTVKAHQKRVFKAAWHRSLPLLISISSDLNIGLHKINAASLSSR